MSFAEKLGQKTFAARTAGHDQWAESILQKFLPACEAAAEQGACQYRMQADPPAGWEDMACQHLRERLFELGFQRMNVDKTRVAKPDRNPRATRAPSYLHDFDTLIDISVQWEIRSTPATPAPNGIKGNCPICHENQNLVALIPCGHTVCKQCYGSHQLCDCPMCRQTLTGATKALFMG
eukprot:Skav234898  [mRNA]  locus=scaffold840:682917:683453:+ [translate_table: standard]